MFSSSQQVNSGIALSSLDTVAACRTTLSNARRPPTEIPIPKWYFFSFAAAGYLQDVSEMSISRREHCAVCEGWILAAPFSPSSFKPEWNIGDQVSNMF